MVIDRQFAKAREALSCKPKQLRRTGKGHNPKKALGRGARNNSTTKPLTYSMFFAWSLDGELVTNIF